MALLVYSERNVFSHYFVLLNVLLTSVCVDICRHTSVLWYQVGFWGQWLTEFSQSGETCVVNIALGV